jgi:putative hemolysin
LTDTTPKAPAQPSVSKPAPHVYNRRALTYSETFDHPVRRTVIKTIEWLTGKIKIIRMVRAFEKRGKFEGQAFWRNALDVMGIDVTTPDEQLARIPETGPVVVVANHPHGLVDGMIFAELIGRVRSDYRILTRAFLTDIDEGAGKFLIPVPFPHEEGAQAKMVEMRKQAMAHLNAGGVVAVFPSGVVASSDTLFGPMIEREWNLFTAKMIRMSGARVVPLFFPGANSRWYQMANRISPTLRQSLLIYEIVRACGKPQKPLIGHPFDADEVRARLSDQRACMDWMRQETLRLKD